MIGFIDTYVQLQSTTTAHNQWLSTTPSILYWTTGVFLLRDWLGSDLRIGHFFSFRCSLVNTPWLNTQLVNCLLNSLKNESPERVLSLLLRPTFRRPVCLGIKHPSGTYDQIFITVGHLRVYCCGTLSLTRGRVCRLQLLLAIASAVILGSESLRTRDHILLSQIRDFPFRRLLRLAGLRWRYSTPIHYL
jgi:hypothetical protein